MALPANPSVHILNLPRGSGHRERPGTDTGALAMLIFRQGLKGAMAPNDGPDAPRRPWVVVNCAMSADGKLALPNRTPVEISSEEDMLRVHRLRASCDAILVGATTVLADDPKLHVSPARVPDPPSLLKVVLDSSGCMHPDARFLSSPGVSLVATVDRTLPSLGGRVGHRAEVRAFGDGPLVDLPALLAHLVDRGVKRLMVEGGGKTIWSFMNEGLVDEMSVYIGPLVIGGEDAPTPTDGEGAVSIADTVGLEVVSVERLGDGIWINYKVTGRH